MKTSQSGKKIGFILLFILIFVAVIMFVSLKSKNSDSGDEERKYKHQVSNTECFIWAYKSTPDIVLDKIENYLDENGFSGDEIEYMFDKSYIKSIHDKRTFRFNVAQYYKGIDCKGCLEVNLEGDIITTNGLKTAKELTSIKTEPAIESTDAIQIGIDYLKLEKNTTDGALDMLYYDSDIEKWIFIYDVRFDHQNISLYVNAITGEVIKEMRGNDVVPNKNFI